MKRTYRDSRDCHLGCIVSCNEFRVRTDPGNPGKSWNFILAFFRAGKSWNINAGPGKSWNFILAFFRTGKSWKSNAGPGKSWKSITLVIKFSLKTIFRSIIFGFQFHKGLLLPLLCTWESWKNLSES